MPGGKEPNIRPKTILATDRPNLTDLVPGPPSVGGLGVPVGLNHSASPTAMDHCGCWLQAAASLPADTPGLVRGYYHEEFNCDYARNGFTNKSIAYAESTDGGLTFAKKGWPHNQIIQPSGANTTATAARGQQVGEGDHSLVVSGDWLFLFFYEWARRPSRLLFFAPCGNSGMSMASTPGTNMW